MSAQVRSVSYRGHAVMFRTGGEDTGGAYALLERKIYPGFIAAPPHIHKNEDEASYILEGELTVKLGDQIVRAGVGSYNFRPRGIFHIFWNSGTKPARFLEIIHPAGFENYFKERAKLLAEAGNTSNENRIAELSRKYNLEIDMNAYAELVKKNNVRLEGTPSQTDK